MEKPTGTLYLIPVTLGDLNVRAVLPQAVFTLVPTLSHYIVENIKTARKFIKAINPETVQAALHFSEISKHADPLEIPSFLDPCLAGHPMGLMSEAGVPGVADPGAEIIALAHKKGICVKPLVGPSSILMAVMSSGLNGQNFAFNGYLPMENAERRKQIKELEQRSERERQSQLFIETPYRNDKLFEELLNTLHNDTQLSISCDISLDTEFIKTMPVALWKKQVPQLHKRPTIFMFSKEGF
jgi:16S rRNA (cytidine1402-2'-O)-methyltransferase